MLKYRGDTLKGKIVCVSGSGNVAQYSVEKINQLGGKVVTLSDSSGFIFDPQGIDKEKLEFVKRLKNVKRGRIKEYAEKFHCTYYHNERPWKIKCQVALPSATQNEISQQEAQLLVNNGCICVSEGANMPSTHEAIKIFLENEILFGPGKAANAGGVSVSGLEMSQNAMRLSWSREEVDQHLQRIMINIHNSCVKYGKKEDGFINYVDGANIGGFVKVAEAMLSQGIV